MTHAPKRKEADLREVQTGPPRMQGCTRPYTTGAVPHVATRTGAEPHVGTSSHMPRVQGHM